MRIKYIWAVLLTALCAPLANAQEKSDLDAPNRCSGRHDVYVYNGQYSAKCDVDLCCYYDKSNKNIEHFLLLVAYSYNPGPGTQKCEYVEKKEFNLTIPRQGKAHFKLTAVDRQVYKMGNGETNLLEKERKLMAVEVDVKFNGKKWENTSDSRKATKIKLKIKPVSKLPCKKCKKNGCTKQNSSHKG